MNKKELTTHARVVGVQFDGTSDKVYHYTYPLGCQPPKKGDRLFVPVGGGTPKEVTVCEYYDYLGSPFKTLREVYPVLSGGNLLCYWSNKSTKYPYLEGRGG